MLENKSMVLLNVDLQLQKPERFPKTLEVTQKLRRSTLFNKAAITRFMDRGNSSRSSFTRKYQAGKLIKNYSVVSN